MQDLNKLLEILINSDIDFILIGGFASVVHGSSLVTQDIDICAVMTPDTIEKLRRCLKRYHPKHRITAKKLSFIDHPEKLDSIDNLYLETDIGIVDIIGDVAGVGKFERLKKKAIEIDYLGYKCKVISLDDLILSKKALSRDKDLIGLKELLAIKKQKSKK